MSQILRLRSGETLEVTEREWELLRNTFSALVPFFEAYAKLPDDAKQALHKLAETSANPVQSRPTLLRR